MSSLNRFRSLAVFALLVALLLGNLPVGAAPAAFADPAFQTTWTRTDQLVSGGALKRSFYWGPGSNTAGLYEPYAEGKDGQHLVQYFDKSRMEINNPDSERNNRFFVTNGLLTKELISGYMQTGNDSQVLRWPAVIPLASDTDDGTAPTYASFRGAVALSDSDKTGQTVTAIIYRAGVLDFEHGGSATYGYDYSQHKVKYSYYEPTTRHNIPDVFWNFLNASGPVLENGRQVTARLNDPYFYATGYPIADAYWSQVKIGGKATVALIQPYERRVLTYVPSAPEGFKVQMGNIGQHYYSWRYNDAGKPAAVAGTCAGDHSPTLGFGKLWNESLLVKINLGCSVSAEKRATVTAQTFTGGKLIAINNYDYYSGEHYQDIYALYSDGTATTLSHIGLPRNFDQRQPSPIFPARDQSSNLLSGLGTALDSPTVVYYDNIAKSGGAPIQYFDGGLMVYPDLGARKIYALHNTTGTTHTAFANPHSTPIEIDRWAVYADTFGG